MVFIRTYISWTKLKILFIIIAQEFFITKPKYKTYTFFILAKLNDLEFERYA